MRIGLALVTGLVKGLADPRNLIKAAVDEIADKVPNWLKKPWKIKSPSEVTAEIGRNMVQGLVVGFNDDVDLKRAVNLMGKSVVDGLNQTFENADFVALTGFIGKDLAKGFGQSTEDIKNSFNDVNDNMKATMKSLRDDFIEQNAKLNELKKADQPNLTDINNQAAVVRQIINQYAEVKSAHTAWVKSLSDEKSELLKVSKSYETVLTNLDKAKTKLEELKKQREDSIAGFTDKFNTLPDIVTQDAEGNAVDQLAVYMEALKHQADAVGAYKTTLDQLRQLGLDDKTYQKLLQEGTADQQFANQLLSGGRTAVQALNTLDLQLKTVSETLATNAGNNLYNAGINAAEGLVRGLEARKGLLRTTMENLAEEIVVALKKKLRIKSPSEVFAELGNFAMQGFAQGLANSSDLVSEALDNATSNALSAMQKTMSNISDTVAKEFDANPVITPVLDLSQVQAQAKDLAMLGDGSSITPTASTSQAALISSQSNANQITDASAEPVGTTVKFEQNNYSPEALSAVEIYRQTRNQLAQLKAGLSLT